MLLFGGISWEEVQKEIFWGAGFQHVDGGYMEIRKTDR